MKTYKYKLRVHTGDRFEAGTIHHIYINLRGETGATGLQSLNGCTSLSRGAVRKFEIHSRNKLGKLTVMDLHSKAYLTIYNEWFCDKVCVKTPEGDEVVFPCYRWLHPRKTMQITPAAATLVFQADNSILQRLRMTLLENAQKTFRWQEYEEGVPQVIKCKGAGQLPAEVRFSFTKEIEFNFTLLAELLVLKVERLADSKSNWSSFSQLDSYFGHLCQADATLQYVKEHWDENVFFGYQFLNGINPMMIQRCSKLPKNFPVTEQMVRGLLGGSTLQQEMQNGRVFLCDYKILDGLVGNTIHGKMHYLTAPLVLLWSNPQDLMLPLAIQLQQRAGAGNPIFLPSDSEHDWRLAKLYVRAAEFSVHEVDFHLLRTHLLAEVFAVATLRNLPAMHPLFKLLFPHIRYTLQINVMARNKLISKDGALTVYSGIGGKAMLTLLKRATTALTYSSLCLPDNIAERGLETLQNYYYKEDGLKLWRTINTYVEGILTHYYTSDDEEKTLKKDSELQAWIGDIFGKAFQKRKATGIPQSFKSVQDLVKFVTMVIFTCSAQHASVNNGQFEFGGWFPNYPSALQMPPPNAKGQTTEETIWKTLPDIGTTVNTLAVLRLLSRKSTDHYPLGYFPEEWFAEEEPRELMKTFQEALKGLSEENEERNSAMELPYTFLDPKNIDNSVAL